MRPVEYTAHRRCRHLSRKHENEAPWPNDTRNMAAGFGLIAPVATIIIVSLCDTLDHFIFRNFYTFNYIRLTELVEIGVFQLQCKFNNWKDGF